MVDSHHYFVLTHNRQHKLTGEHICKLENASVRGSEGEQGTSCTSTLDYAV